MVPFPRGYERRVIVSYRTSFYCCLVPPTVRRSGTTCAQLKCAPIDHELADGVHYAYQFRSDGMFTGFNTGNPVDGAWRIDGNECCWIAKRRNVQEECFEVKRGDHSVRLLRDGYEALRGKLSPVASQRDERLPR